MTATLVSPARLCRTILSPPCEVPAPMAFLVTSRKPEAEAGPRAGLPRPHAGYNVSCHLALPSLAALDSLALPRNVFLPPPHRKGDFLWQSQ